MLAFNSVAQPNPRSALNVIAYVLASGPLSDINVAAAYVATGGAPIEECFPKSPTGRTHLLGLKFCRWRATHLAGKGCNIGRDVAIRKVAF
jgi:hypothetical protein